MDVGRLIVDEPASGVWNMAVDQALLESAENDQRVTFRLYRWAEPTLSIGYFQNHDTRQSHLASLDCPLVRRRTGGGAIVHDQELTYSLAIPAAHRWSRHSTELYDQVHRALIAALAPRGLESQLYSEACAERSVGIPKHLSEGPAEGGQEPFLCFQRRSDGDVVCGDHKLIGSAQRRLKRSLLQHGSILLGRSACAPELTGITELIGRALDWDQLTADIVKVVRDTLQIQLEPDKLLPGERDAAQDAVTHWFGQTSWNQKR